MPRILSAPHHNQNQNVAAAAECSGFPSEHPASATQESLGGVFGTEDALKTRAGKLNAYEALALCGSFDNVDYAALRREVSFGATRSVARKRDADFEIGADGNVETRDERSAAAA
jgi:hypothetical protein